MIFQSPIPTDIWQWIFSNKAWSEFPVVFLLVACFALATYAGRWFWLDFKHEQARSRAEAALARAEAAIEAEKDREWKEHQNEKRELAAAAESKLWRDVLASQFTTLEKISTSMVELRGDLRDHDKRVGVMSGLLAGVEQNTRPRPNRPRE